MRRLANVWTLVILFALIVGAAWLASGNELAIVAAVVYVAVLALIGATWVLRNRGRSAGPGAPPEKGS